jgi:hypothetical protein
MKSKEVFDGTAICPFFFDEDFQAAWQDWQIARKKMKAVMTDNSAKRHLLNMMRLCKGDKALAIKIVDQSTDGGNHPWTKLYEYHEPVSYSEHKKEVPPQPDAFEEFGDTDFRNPEADEVLSRTRGDNAGV